MIRTIAIHAFERIDAALNTFQARYQGVATRFGRVAILAGAIAACAPALGQLWRLEVLAAAHTLGEAVAIAGMAVMVESSATREGRSKPMCEHADDEPDHDHHRWEDDGGRPCGGCTREGHPAEPPSVNFPSPPQLPRAELPAGEEYGRMISGG